jgi:glycosyltransferase involved in cell wall biosynthesis
VAPHKGVHLLLEALALLGDEGARFDTRVVGSSELRATEDLNDYERRLREIAGRARGRVTFEPYVPQDQVAELYRWSDVVAVPSVAEPFGMVPLEAMSTGALVLGSRAGALPEVLGSAGRLVDPDLAGWVAALRSVTRDDVEAACGPAVARAREFTWARAQADLLEALAAH